MAETQENDSGCQQTSYKCPSSPYPGNPGEYKIPDFPTGYYDKLSDDLKEQLESEKNKALNAAKEKKTEAKNKAEDDWKVASSEYDAAKEKRARDKSLIDDKSKNKKLELRQNYRNKLRESLPKSCTGSIVDIEKDPKVPVEDKAVCIADFLKALKDEELDYLTKIKALDDLFTEADNKYKKSKHNYDLNNCNAETIEAQAQAVAELEWRKKLSAAVKQICNM
jgi:hypothetical protein